MIDRISAERRAFIERVRLCWETEKLGSTEIATRLGTTKNAVVGMAHRYGFARRESPIAPGCEWTAEADAKLREMAARGASRNEIAAALGHTPDSISARNAKLHLPSFQPQRKASAPKPPRDSRPEREKLRTAAAVVTAAPLRFSPREPYLPVAPRHPKPVRFRCLSPGELPARDGCNFLVNDGRPWQFCAEPAEVVIRDGVPVTLVYCAGHRAICLVPVRPRDSVAVAA